MIIKRELFNIFYEKIFLRLEERLLYSLKIENLRNKGKKINIFYVFFKRILFKNFKLLKKY